jgi:hypothetical protein
MVRGGYYGPPQKPCGLRFWPIQSRTADHHNRRLLRVRRERPSRRTDEKRDERAALHSITSSARTSMPE